MVSFQEVMIGKVVELLSVLKKDYCSKNYLKGVLTPLTITPYPQTPGNPSMSRTPFLPTFSSNQSKPKYQKRAQSKQSNFLNKNSPKSNLSKPTYKRASVSKTRNKSLKTISTKTQKKKKKKLSKSRSKQRKNKSGSPCSYKELNNNRYMSALKYVNPHNPGRFWLTGTLGRSKKRRKVRKKSNSLNMKKKNQQLSLSQIRKEGEDELESVWGCSHHPGRQSKVIKV
jgi:hypothetical protein